MAPVLHRTRASCTALRTAEELRGGAGTSSFARAPRRGRLLVLVGLGLAMLSGCSRTAVGRSEGSDTMERLHHARPTLEELGRLVLQSLARQDTIALNRIRLTETEHNEIVWPELPAAAPEVNFPVDYAWTNIRNRNTRGMSRLLPHFAGRPVGFQWVECRGGSEPFETFVVHTDCHVVFTLDGSPELWEVQAFKDALERGGAFKVFRYYDEEPRRHRRGEPT